MSRRTIRVTALAFAVLYLVSVFLPTLPEGAYPDERVLAIYSDSGERWRAEVAGAALVLAGLSLLAFVSQALAAGATPGSRLGALAGRTATAYAVMLMVSATAFTALAAGVNVGELPADSVTADIARVVTVLGFYALLGPGLIAAGATVAALSRIGHASGTLPDWCARLGYGVGALCLVPFWPIQFLPVLWVLCAGLTLDPRRGLPRDGSASRSVSVDAPA
jgi:hypothetical protein